MMLGDLLAAARDQAGAFQAWVAAREPELAARMRDAASREGMSEAGYARAAVADFSRFASEEDWATLTSSLRDSPDPGSLCLLAMVDWRLRAILCEDHRPPAPTEGSAP